MDKIIQLTLTTLTYGGEAMGRHEGRAVFVPFGLPGEIVRARLVEERKNFARAELVEIIQASPERIQPKCAHFGACGGCHYQMLPYPAQLRAKTEILRDQLTRIGKIQNSPVRDIVASPQTWNYRNHVQFHLDKNGKLGFIAAGAAPAAGKASDAEEIRPESVIPINECHLPESALNALWPTLEFEPDAPIERVSLRAGDELMLILESGSPEAPEMEIETDISVVHLTEDDAVVMAGEDYIVMDVLERSFKVSAGSFFQVNTQMAGKMVQHLLDQLKVNKKSTVLVDVYCGVGLFSAFFAPKVARLIGIETSISSCDDFAVNLDEFNNVELYEADAEEALPALDVQPDVVIVDPPRAGLDKTVIDALVALKPKTLAYVSCDPSTLARDAARLIAGGYQLKQVTPFDLFPQTYHIESISIFEPVTRN
jgi:23S rRNA (uracil1939-C5)-methyltransferase